jgi:hypothetical protein
MSSLPPESPQTTSLEEQASEPSHRSRRWWWIVAAVVVAIIVGVLLIVFVALTKGGPAYRVSYVSVEPTGPSTAKVVFVVENTGGSAGTPVCTVKASALNGVATQTFIEHRPVTAGNRSLYINTVPVSNGASSLLKPSDLSITCHTPTSKST